MTLDRKYPVMSSDDARRKIFRFFERIGFSIGPSESLQMAYDLVEWFNCTTLDWDDIRSLIRLALDDQFDAWNCPTCETRVYCGTPDNWNHFQGARQVDYTSYPAGSQYQCDSCRAHRSITAECRRCGHPTEEAEAAERGARDGSFRNMRSPDCEEGLTGAARIR